MKNIFQYMFKAFRINRANVEIALYYSYWLQSLSRRKHQSAGIILVRIQCLACELYAQSAVRTLWFGKATFLLGWPNLHRKVAHTQRWITACRWES